MYDVWQDTLETKGTVFHGRHHSQETSLECLAWLAERNSLAAIHRVKGIKEETVRVLSRHSGSRSTTGNAGGSLVHQLWLLA